MKLKKLFKDKSDEQISAFAFNLGRVIENTIKGKIGDTMDENMMLKAQILEFRQKILLNGGMSDFSILKKYDEHFQIKQL